MSLRRRLTAATVLLLVLGLVVADAAAYLVLRDGLQDRLDRNLVTIADRSLATTRATGDGALSFDVVERTLPAEVYLALYDAQGRLLHSRPPDGQTADVPGPAALPSAPSTVPGSALRVLGRQLPPGKAVQVEVLGEPREVAGLVVGISLRSNRDTLRRLLVIQCLTGLAVVLLLVLGAHLALRRGLRPLQAVADTARDISRGRRVRRVPVGSPRTELGAVALDPNDAFDARDRTEQLVRSFVSDASHELRTPLSSIHGWADLYLSGGIDDWDGVDTAMRRIRGETTRMSALVEQLLALARLDAQEEIAFELVDLALLCADVLADAPVTAPEHHLVSSADGPVVVSGDPQALRRVVRNLVDNAVRHTPAGTSVHVHAWPEQDDVVLRVRDSGPGLSATARARAFDRFWRADTSRTAPGSSLGLAIVGDTVRAHGGSVQLRDGPGGGLDVLIHLAATATDGSRRASSGAGEAAGPAG